MMNIKTLTTSIYFSISMLAQPASGKFLRVEVLQIEGAYDLEKLVRSLTFYGRITGGRSHGIKQQYQSSHQSGVKQVHCSDNNI